MSAKEACTKHGCPTSGEVSSRRREIAARIDHTLLKSEAVEGRIIEHCKEAAEYGFRSVCVFPAWVKTCSEALKNHDTLVCTVIGFPFGANLTKVKCLEAELAVKDGADELDIVVNIGFVKAGNWQAVEEDLKAVLDHSSGKTTKVIIETCLLNDHEKELITAILERLGVNYLKTSTGFSSAGASLKDVAKIYRKYKGSIKIKASGGIKTLSQVLSFVEAGADVIGSSSGKEIIQEIVANGHI